MRNAIAIGDDFVVTTDNSGGIGEKPADSVAVPDRLTAYYAARVALLEQWAVCAEPTTILIHNFSGGASWEKYVAGVTDLFHEAGLELPPISGSTETNMELMQSAMAVTMIGKRRQCSVVNRLIWFTYGAPLVGQEVLDYAEQVASLRRIREAIDQGVVSRIWPVGSGGILKEVRNMMGNAEVLVESTLDVAKTAGPSTVVLLGVLESRKVEAEEWFGKHVSELKIG